MNIFYQELCWEFHCRLQAGAKREANQAELDLESHPITTPKGHVKWVLARISKMVEGSISVRW